MKSIRVLIFILSVIVLLGIGWYFFPAEGVQVGDVSLRYPSYAEEKESSDAEEVDVDDVLNKVNKSFEMDSENMLDS